MGTRRGYSDYSGSDTGILCIIICIQGELSGENAALSYTIKYYQASACSAYSDIVA